MRVGGWFGVAAALVVSGCGARTGLDVPPPDVVDAGPPPPYCQGNEATSIYVVTNAGGLHRFTPSTKSFSEIATLDCPVASAASPFSMAVDYAGTAYVVFDDGELFLVDTGSGSCTAPSAPIDSSAFTFTFGMGFSSNPGGHSETLFVASVDAPGRLGTLDTHTSVVHDIGAFSSDIGQAELTGTGDGRLFAFGVGDRVTSAHLAEIDKEDASVITDVPVPTPTQPVAWAFAFWGGDFYFFTSVDGATSQVGRYRPADGSFDATYATLMNGAITGAGVSTCAPR